MVKQSRAADQEREAERKHGPAPAVGLRPRAGATKAAPAPVKSKAKPKTEAKGKGRAKTKPKRKPRARPVPAVEPAPVDLDLPEEFQPPPPEDAWASLRSRFSPETQALVDSARATGFSREDLITLELAVGLELQGDANKARGKTKALLQNTFMQSRKNLVRLLDKAGLKKKLDPKVMVPEGMRNIEPLKKPDPGREVDARPTEAELPERYH